MKINNKKALSLIEVMVTAVISTFIIAGVYSALMTGNRSWAHYSNTIMARQDARRALFAMARELREAKNILIIKDSDKDSNSARINFYRPSMGMVSYIWSDSGGQANKVIRQDELNTRILAKNISAITFEYLKNAVLVDLTVHKTSLRGRVTEFNLKEKIALRSKTKPFM